MTRQLLEHTPDLLEAERRHLARTAPHVFRHTFGTQAVASGVPLDVAQRVLGHASLQTTTVYVTAEQQRTRRELAGYFATLDPQSRPEVVPSAPARSGPVDAPMTGTASMPPAADPQGQVLESTMRTAIVLLTLDVHNNSAYVRGRKRVVREVEMWILDDYEAVKVGDDEYELKAPYETDAELDGLVQELRGDIQPTADDRHCFSESQARLDGSDRVWS